MLNELKADCLIVHGFQQQQSTEHEGYISQLTLYSKACAQQHHFMNREQLLTLKLFKPDYVVPIFKSSLQKPYGCHHELVDIESIPFGVHLFLFDTTDTETFTELDYIKQHSKCYIRNRNCLSVASYWAHIWFLSFLMEPLMLN